MFCEWLYFVTLKIKNEALRQLVWLSVMSVTAEGCVCLSFIDRSFENSKEGHTAFNILSCKCQAENLSCISNFILSFKEQNSYVWSTTWHWLQSFREGFFILQETGKIFWLTQSNPEMDLHKGKAPIILIRNLISSQTKSAVTFSELAPMDSVHKAYEPPAVIQHSQPNSFPDSKDVKAFWECRIHRLRKKLGLAAYKQLR